LIEEGLVKQKVFDVVMFQTTGPAGIFALYAPAGYPLGTVFLNEFVVDFVLGVVVFACTDPTNHLVPPAAGPWVVGMAFATAIWGFAVNGVAINTARDLGGRLFAITVWGKAANGGTYAAIAALTNIPATILASLFYQFVFADSQRGTYPMVSYPYNSVDQTLSHEPRAQVLQRFDSCAHHASSAHTRRQ
jgi:glycerol uptake facilitator-like aquaporin